MIHTTTLKGHKSPVISLAHSSESFSRQRYQNISKKKKKQQNEGLHVTCHLLSGDESGTTRVWDLRQDSKRASHCILNNDGEEVTAVGFHPLFDNPSNVDNHLGQTNEVSCPFTIYTAVGPKVYGYDLRHMRKPSIVTQHDFSVSNLDGADEINKLDFLHMPKQKNVYLVSGSDDGFVRVINTKDQTNIVYQHSLDNSPALVTSVAFRPRSIKTIDVASAGTDCTICLWDITRPHNSPSSSLTIQQGSDENASKSGINQICNPPIVHQICWSPSGQLLSAGLGDGTCLIAAVEGRDLVEKCRLEGHDSSVASVLFPRFGFDLGAAHVTAEDRLLVSAGSDSSILFWDLGSKVAGNESTDPSSMFINSSNEGSENQTNISGDVTDDFGKLSLEGQRMLYSISHKQKINQIVSSGNEHIYSKSLFVSDISNEITIYEMSMI